MEGSLWKTCPKNANGLGWVQIHQKSLHWEEIIKGSSVITHEDRTTLAHPKVGWTIMSGTWNTLRTSWGKNLDTITRIHESITTQDSLECTGILTPTRHILDTIKQMWQLKGIHGLPAVATPAFFQSDSRNDLFVLLATCETQCGPFQ